MRNFIRSINVSRTVCDHLLDEKHTNRHRMGVGGIIIFMGVAVSKIPINITVIHFILDGVGYAIHGIGLVPFIEWFQKRFAHEQQ